MTKGEAIYHLIKIHGTSLIRAHFTETEIKRANRALKTLTLPKEEETDIRHLMEIDPE